MNTHQSDRTEAAQQSQFQRNQRDRRRLRWLTLGTTVIIVALLGLAIYQRVTTGQFTPLFWTVIGLIALMVVGITVGLIVAAKMGTGSYTPSAKVSGSLRTESQSVDEAGASSLQVDLDMSVGELRLSGGSAHALDATFIYDDADWRLPEVQYHVDATGVGNLRVKQQASQRPSMRTGPSEWKLRLNDQLPMELHVHLGAGKADLKLSGLPLTLLGIEGGVGAVDIDLTGEWKDSLTGHIRGGVGEMVLHLPENVGARIETSGGLGHVEAGGLIREGDAYVNGAYGKTPTTLRLAVEMGLGSLRFQ